jgi:hypothetical protein
LDYVRRSMVLDVLPRRVMGEGGGMDATLDVMRILEEYGRWKTEIFSTSMRLDNVGEAQRRNTTLRQLR